jgi:DnaK suppressor protein
VKKVAKRLTKSGSAAKGARAASQHSKTVKEVGAAKAQNTPKGTKAAKGNMVSKKDSRSTEQVVAKKLSGKSQLIKSPKPKRVAPFQDYSQFRAILLEKRRRLAGDVAMMSEEALGSEDASVDNHAPIHPAEVGSHSFEQEFTLGLLSRDGDKIRLVDMALEKIAEGSYGQCDECGGRIPKGRLEMLPESIYCVKCASRLEGPGI